MSKDVKQLTLSNGELIIGKIKSQDDKKVVLDKPFSIIVGHDQTGQFQMQLAPYNIFAKDDEQTFYIHALMSPPTAVQDKLVQAYVKATTGIEIPETQGLILG